MRGLLACALLSAAPAALGQEPIIKLDFRSELESSAVSRIQQTCSSQEPSSLQLAEAFAAEVFPSAMVYYEASLCLNKRSQLSEALRALNQALLIDPNHVASLYDRAELLLINGERAQAKVDLERLLNQEMVHWAVHYRRAEIAGLEQDVRVFDGQLRKALFEGFEIRLLLESGQTWLGFVRDEQLGPVIQQLVLLYADAALWEELERRAQR